MVDPGQRVLLRHTKVTLATNGEHGRIEVELVFGADAADVQQLTSRPEHLGQRLALVVGRDRVLSAPTLQAPMGDRGRVTMAGATAANRGAIAAIAVQARELVDAMNDETQLRLRPVALPPRR